MNRELLEKPFEPARRSDPPWRGPGTTWFHRGSNSPRLIAINGSLTLSRCLRSAFGFVLGTLLAVTHGVAFN